MPKQGDFSNRKPTKKASVQIEPIWVTKIDLEYAYSKLKMCEKTSSQYSFAFFMETSTDATDWAGNQRFI